MLRLLRLYLSSLLISIVILFILPVVANAVDDPDNISILDIAVNRHLVQTDDALYCALYNIDYTSSPNESVDKTFTFRLIDTDGDTTLGTAVPYPYNDNGYGVGLISFYFGNATAPDWGDNYIIRITGNPVYFDDPPTKDISITAGSYTAYDDHDNNQIELAQWIIITAQYLDLAWGTLGTTSSLVEQSDIGTVLSESGEAYFRNTIYGIQSMAPDAFLVERRDPVYTERTWSENQSTTLEQRFAGTAIQNSIDEWGEFWNADVQVVNSWPFIILAIGIISIHAARWRNPLAGFPDALVILSCGVLMGLVSLQVRVLITFFSGIYILYFLVWGNKG